MQGQQIDISEEGIVKVFKVPWEGLMARALKGYNGVVTTYFVGIQQDHYIFKLGYLIAQVDGKARV
jgi:hypothetical protein